MITQKMQPCFFSEKEYLSYSLGALLYTPALNGTVADNLFSGQFPDIDALVLCLEDTIQDESLAHAEVQLVKSLEKIGEHVKRNPALTLPKLFIRVRTPEQLVRIYDKTKVFSELLTGFALPKFQVANGLAYQKIIRDMNNTAEKPVYIMPILETGDILSLETRREVLFQIKTILDGIEDYVLNIRVGGNDFCNFYGFRRNANQTIYDIGVLNYVLSDILTVFLGKYVVSAPVWEYFSNNSGVDWERGLKQELSLDKLNGFVGKTAIHPCQLPIIRNSLRVLQKDLDDARSILNWDNASLAVAKNSSGDRMNEWKVHEKWARKTILLAEIYGVCEETAD